MPVSGVLLNVEALLLENQCLRLHWDRLPSLLQLVEKSIIPFCLGLRDFKELRLPVLMLGQSWANRDKLVTRVVCQKAQYSFSLPRNLTGSLCLYHSEGRKEEPGSLKVQERKGSEFVYCISVAIICIYKRLTC